MKHLWLILFLFSFSVAQDIEYENLINTKWGLKKYIIDGQSFPIEKKRKKDYYILRKIIKRKRCYTEKK